MNKVFLIGRAGRAPEQRFFESGRVKADVSLAVDRPAGKDERKETDWFDIEAWGRTAEVLAEYVRKGSQFAVDGRLQVKTWTTDNGDKRSKTIIVADRIELLGGKKEGGSDTGNGDGGTRQKVAQGAKQASRDEDLDAIFEEDEIPF